jgi:cell division protein FtsX
MSGLQYQIRIYLTEELAQAAGTEEAQSTLKPLLDVLSKHRSDMKSQYDAFAEYVAEAEKNGAENYPLYKWTKVTIEDPVKKAKYQKAFTIYAEGQEVYDKQIADALEADLQPLVKSGLVAQVSKHDTNPANNPQPPAHLR